MEIGHWELPLASPQESRGVPHSHLYTAGQSRPSIHSQHLPLQQSWFLHTSLLLHLAVGKGLERLCYPRTHIPGGMGLPGPFPRALWQPQTGPGGDTNTHSWQGQAAHTRSGAGRVPQSLGPLVPRLHWTWLPLAPFSPTDIHGHSPCPQLSYSIMDHFQHIFSSAHSNTGGIQHRRLASLLFLYLFLMDLVLDSVSYQSWACPGNSMDTPGCRNHLQNLNIPPALTSPYLLWQLYLQTTPANYLNMTSLAWMSARYS